MSTYRSGIRHAGFRISLLALAVSAGSAWAEEPLVMEHVEVIGQAVSIDEALKDQRNSDSVESVVHADGIGQLPDDNAAEALQRIPGISVERDQGEGRFVSVRGIAPDLNSVTINGTLVPSPESDRRAVALDVLPSELVQSLSVVKTLTPDMDANSWAAPSRYRACRPSTMTGCSTASAARAAMTTTSTRPARNSPAPSATASASAMASTISASPRPSAGRSAISARTTSRPAASGTLPTTVRGWRNSSSATTRSPASVPASG